MTARISAKEFRALARKEARPSRARRKEEQDLQIAVAGMLDLIRLPEWIFFHVPNGGVRSKAEAAILKAMGVKAGVHDIVIIWRGRCIVIELKAPDGKLSKAQKDWAVEALLAGVVIFEARSMKEVLAILDLLAIPHKPVKL
ncbi:MAG TPA: VRR-NUC domain-containing protein [Rhizomicrobium sp.]